MKLQSLAIIFIIIFIPIVLLFSYYLDLETTTIRIQTDYDGKLMEATQEAIEAFEINTTEWAGNSFVNIDTGTLANVKRNKLESSTNVFISGLANKLGVGGTSKENMLQYIPAIVYIMYDGYYIYSPTYVPKTYTDANGVQLFYHEDAGRYKITNSPTLTLGSEVISDSDVGQPIFKVEEGKSGESATYYYYDDTQDGTNNEKSEDIYFTTNPDDAQKTYKHVLKTFVPYTNIITDKNNNKTYVINYTLGNYIRVVRVYGEDESREGPIISREGQIINEDISIIKDNSIDVSINGKKIEPEYLFENIPARGNINDTLEVKKYGYIYDSNNIKRYYDRYGFFSIDSDYQKIYLPDATSNSELSVYKKLLVPLSDDTSEVKYEEIYQKLNDSNDSSWYDSNGDVWNRFTLNIEKEQDVSAINYYVKNYCFNNWLEDKGININETNKKEAIIDNINKNLNLSMSNYSANSSIDYKLPELTDEDWEQALSNISMITFFQGVKVGLKTYNNYSIVTSTHNNEYISNDSLYYLGNNDIYYHRKYCNSINGLTNAYLNTEFKVNSYNCEGDEHNEISGYYYKHLNQEEEGNALYNSLECFNCIVNRNNIETTDDDDTKATYLETYYRAIARERYIQSERTKLIDE